MAILPDSSDRTAVIGSTGSGKTQFGAWLLSKRDFNLRAWVIFDFKGDELLDEIGATEISVKRNVPVKAGLYIVRPLPHDDFFVSEMFRQIWQNENTGIYIDEGYMVPKNCRWFRACLTQGRSRNIEMIVLSQRPVFMDKFVFTEANYFAIFNMNYEEDRKHVKAYTGGLMPDILEDFHSLWYNVKKQKKNVFSPVPDADTIIATFRKRLDNKPEII